MDELNKTLGEIKASLDEKMNEYNAQFVEHGKANESTRADVKALAQDVEQLEASLLELQQKSVAYPSASASTLSLGEQFVACDSLKDYLAGSRNFVNASFSNAITTTSGGFKTREEKGVIAPAYRTLSLLDAITKASTGASSIRYEKVNVAAGKASMKAEATAVAESGLTFTDTTVNVQSISHWRNISEEMLSDAPYVSSVINQELVFGVRDKIADQILNGDATGNNLDGLLKTGNHTDLVVSGDATIYEAALRAIATLEVTGRAPAYFVMHPLDVFAIEVAKGTDDHFLTRGVARINGQLTLGGVPIVKSANIAQNTMVAVGERAAIYFDREQVSISTSSENSTNYVDGTVTFKAAARGCVTVPYANAVLVMDLSTLGSA